MEPIESSETSAYINTLTPGTYPKEKKQHVEKSWFTGPYSVPCNVLKQKTIPLIDVQIFLLWNYVKYNNNGKHNFQNDNKYVQFILCTKRVCWANIIIIHHYPRTLLIYYRHYMCIAWVHISLCMMFISQQSNKEIKPFTFMLSQMIPVQ